MWEIIGAVAAVVSIPLAIWAALPKTKITADAQLDITNYLSVRVQAHRSPITVTAIRPVVYFTPDQPGQTQFILNTAATTPFDQIDLDARQVRLVGIELKMDAQDLPEPDGSPVLRLPTRDEIRVRIDYGGKRGRNKSEYIAPTVVPHAITRH